MASRRPSGKAMLAAVAALVALAGGVAAAWVAASDDDDPARPGTSVATAPTPDTPDTTDTQAIPEPPPETNPQIEETERAAEDPPAPAETTGGGTRKTHFPRERREQRNDPVRHEFAIPPAREFSGNGNATLGTVDLRQPAVVKWSTKGRFELRFGREAFPIIAPSASGQLIVPPYSFERVRVIAKGRWKISITPQK